MHFVTGNKHKLAEAQGILGDDLESMELDLPEIQGSEADIARFKASTASELTGEEVFVEDVSIRFTALNGLPGPYIKHFIKNLTREQIVGLLAPYTDKSAEVVCTIGYCKQGLEPVIITGTISGRIVPARGESGFGFDPIFQPDGYPMTFAEMSAEQKNAISHRRKALMKLRAYLDIPLTGKIKQIIRQLTTLMPDGCVWAFTGSINQGLQGMDVTPHDIDILSRKQDFSRIKDAFCAYQPREEERKKESSSCQTLCFDVDDVHVEIIADDDDTALSRLTIENTQFILLGDIAVPCMLLSEEAKAYQRLGRSEKAQHIQSFLDDKSSDA